MASRRRGSATRRVRRVLAGLALVVVVTSGLLLGGIGVAEAHPLGNFTINLYDGLTVRTQGIDIDYVVDMAEIPAFEEKQTIDANGDGSLDPTETAAYVTDTSERLASGVTLSVANTAVPVRIAGTGTVSFPAGAGGLSTMRLECPIRGRVAISEDQPVSYKDGNFAGRIGWHEVTVVGDRLALLDSDAPAQSVSARLTSYPADLLQSPLDQRTASFRIGGATDVPAAPVADVAAPIAPRLRWPTSPRRSHGASAIGSRPRSPVSSRPAGARRCSGCSRSRPPSPSAGSTHPGPGPARRLSPRCPLGP